MADVFSAESRLIHAGTERTAGLPATPPLAPASIYVSQGTPRPGRGYGRAGNPGWEALEQALGGLEDAGATASLYSLTKAISGHSDVILGAVVSRDAGLLADVRAWRSSGGGIPGPFEAWLALRGLKTLPLRIARQSASALAIAGYLAGHPRVSTVHYPGLDGPGVDKAISELARRQMPDGFGPLLSVEVRPDSADAADKVVASSRLILPATSFGGVESTWERRARWPAETAPAGLIRLSVGVEPAADLITDIDHALEVL